MHQYEITTFTACELKKSFNFDTSDNIVATFNVWFWLNIYVS